MPLLDHFHPPLNVRRHWQGFHSAWANAIVSQLNQEMLPEGYYAEPNIQVGGQIEIDVGTLREEAGEMNGGVATKVWAPPRPSVVETVDFAGLDVFEIQILRGEEGPKLVAAIELVSPANKDRPAHRRAFAIKCAAYLQAGVSVVIVDIVTSRTASLHDELFGLLNLASKPLAPLYAVAYRTISANEQVRLEAWPEALRVGEELPAVPLWLSADAVLELNLEQSYAVACENLRIE